MFGVVVFCGQPDFQSAVHYLTQGSTRTPSSQRAELVRQPSGLGHLDYEGSGKLLRCSADGTCFQKDNVSQVFHVISAAYPPRCLSTDSDMSVLVTMPTQSYSGVFAFALWGTFQISDIQHSHDTTRPLFRLSRTCDTGKH